MKRQFLLLITMCITMLSFSQVISNEAFILSNSHGDLLMRRYISEDLTWKRALVPTATQLLMNYGGDFSNGVRIQGSKLQIDGNVGIGTATPDSKLTVAGHVNIGGTGNYRLKTRHIDGKDYDSADVDNLYLNYNTSKNVYIGWGGQNSNMFVSGNIGIGTTIPLSSLHIEDINAGGEVGITIKNKDASVGTRSVIDFITTTTSTVYGSLGVENTSLGAGAMTFSTRGGNFEKMRITSSGNIGIGTTIPDEKLTVKGNIHAEEVRVDLSVPGPDYVFAADYKLTPLQELQQYVNTNKHLPNIPSAKDMEANGIELGVMNMKLLEKIEELALYTIQQQKQINVLQIKVEKLIKNQ